MGVAIFLPIAMKQLVIEKEFQLSVVSKVQFSEGVSVAKKFVTIEFFEGR